MPRAKGATNFVSIHIVLLFSSASKCFKRNKSNSKKKYCSEMLIPVVLSKLEIWFWFLDSSDQDSCQSWCNNLRSWNRVPFIGMRCIALMCYRRYARWWGRTVFASSNSLCQHSFL